MRVKQKRAMQLMNNWQTKKLGDIAKIYDGTHQTPTYIEQGVPFYSVEQVTANNFENTKFIAEDVYEKECRRVMIENGDVLMTRIGDIGTARYVDWSPKASFYVSLALIKPTGINGRFLSYVINSYYFQKELWKRSLTVAFPYKINLGDIGKSVLLIPEKPEQERIVAVLETWDEYIEKLEQKIALKEQLKKGLMQQLLTGKRRLPKFKNEWYEATLADLVEITTGRKDVNQGNPNGIYPFFTCSRKHTYSDEYSFDTEAILIAGNGDVGHCKYYIGKFEAYQRTYVLSNFDKVSAQYIFPFMRHYFQHFIDSQKQMGAMPFIKVGMLRDFTIVLPKDRAEQEAISGIVKFADDEIDFLNKKLSSIKLQKKYLLKNLITGTIRTPEDLQPLNTTRLERSAL